MHIRSNPSLPAGVTHIIGIHGPHAKMQLDFLVVRLGDGEQFANDRTFLPQLIPPAACTSEIRGQGTMNETATRIVRTAIDQTTAATSRLVLGEVITFPGKWSSYPPHNHPQPELNFTSFSPPAAFVMQQLAKTLSRSARTVRL